MQKRMKEEKRLWKNVADHGEKSITALRLWFSDDYIDFSEECDDDVLI